MKNNILIVILFVLFSACNSKTNEKNNDNKAPDTIKRIVQKIERFFPEEKNVEEFDTILSGKQLQILIKKTNLDTFITREYEVVEKKQIDKYRDTEISLVIKQNSEILLDTVFRKENFISNTPKDFMKIAVFNDYSFDKIEKDRIEFWGTVSEPETCSAFDFHHYFDLKSKKLYFEEDVEEDE